MAKGIGRLVQIGFAKETTRGTSPAAAAYWPNHSSVSIDEKDEKVLDEQVYGVIEDSTGTTKTKKYAEATIEAPITDKSFGLLLLAALGTDTPTTHAGESIIYDHAFTVAQSATHQTLSLYLNDPLGAQDYSYALGALTSLELKYELGKFLTYSASFKTKAGATATLTPANTAENRFIPSYLTFKQATNLAGLTGATALSIKSFTLKITKDIEDDDVLGSIDPADFLNKKFTIEGDLEAIWQNEADFKTAFLANTAKAFRIDASNSDVTIGTAAHPQFKIDLAKVTFKELARSFGINDVVKQKLSFKAHYSTADTTMINALLVNAVATY